MSPEVIQIVLPLTFLGICALVGEILVQGHRDKAAEERLQMPAAPSKGFYFTRKKPKSAARNSHASP